MFPPGFVTLSALVFALLRVFGAAWRTGPHPCYCLTCSRPTGVCCASSGLQEVRDLTLLPSFSLCPSAASAALFPHRNAAQEVPAEKQVPDPIFVVTPKVSRTFS